MNEVVSGLAGGRTTQKGRDRDRNRDRDSDRDRDRDRDREPRDTRAGPTH